ncbi:MAG TPA: cob(I)yrinic acid a,c-diamide adenosyltransferase [Pirellulales bacterium]|nr:cob(I)yrinic acid a,c-diamide adenosyltransferase [Pirellulales bacterium]
MIVNTGTGTGKGKGKGTAAFGTAMRALGNGFSVLVVQIIKGHWTTGERAAADRFEKLEFRAMGEGATWDTNDRRRDTRMVMEAWAFARQ